MVSRHFRSSSSLALSPGCSPAQTLARQSLRQHWRVVGSLPRAAPAHTCPPPTYLLPHHMVQLTAAGDLLASNCPETVLKLGQSLHPLAN